MERVPQRQRKGQAGAAENTEVLVASGAWFDLESFSRRTKKTFLEGNQKKEPQLDTNILYIYIYIYIYKKEVALQTKVLPPEGRFLHQFLSGI